MHTMLDYLEDEINGCVDYAMLAVEEKTEGDASKATLFYNMALTEYQHAENILSIIKEKQKDSQTMEMSGELWDYIHKDITKDLAKAKVHLAAYKM